MASGDYHLDDTIVAVASPKGGAARGMVRLSGPETSEIVRQLLDGGEKGVRNLLPERPEGCFAQKAQKVPDTFFSPSVLSGRLRLETADARPLSVPVELYLWPTHRSYTGGQVAEFHTLGSPPLLDAIVRDCCRHGARLAEPGEFTLRAFLTGRIDLTQAEAVAGIIDADDPAELDTALDQLAGGLARPLQTLRSEMLDLLAHLEAGFDYADEDLGFITTETLVADLRQCLKETEGLLSRLQRRADTGDAVRVGLFGRSNVGKSSLFNALAGDTRAIVSHYPGTTRDYLTAVLDLDGIRFELIDTAGVDPERMPTASPDRAARQVSTGQAERANVRLICLDTTFQECSAVELVRRFSPSDLIVITKTDTLDAEARRDVERKCQAEFGCGAPVFTSAVTHEGIQPLLERVSEMVLAVVSPGGTAVATTSARCEASLRAADDALRRALRLAESSLGEELVAAELRLALESIGKVAGAVYTEDILEQVFRRFCVGK